MYTVWRLCFKALCSKTLIVFQLKPNCQNMERGCACFEDALAGLWKSP